MVDVPNYPKTWHIRGVRNKLLNNQRSFDSAPHRRMMSLLNSFQESDRVLIINR